MVERLKAIDEYYINLEYESDKTKALMEISILSKEIKFTDVNDFSERFLETASVIEKKLFLFKSACEHIDKVTTIIQYLTNFGAKFMFSSICGNRFDEEYKRGDEILLVMLTILNVCEEPEVQLFLENAIIKHSALEKSYEQYKHLKQLLSHSNEMILLEDSDLYAVISYLRIKKSILLSLNKIWVQEPIKEKFLCLVKKSAEYFEYLDFPIHVFRAKKQLLTASTPNKMNIVSIWSEDITAAKNLATSLNKDVLFINTYMDYYGGIVLLPYIRIFDKTLHKWCASNLDDCATELSVQKRIVHNLFYDGTWQQPIKGTYWIHNDSQWANATSDDINRCINLAEKGFKIWSTKSITCRMQVLSEFAFTLKCNGKPILADIISKWIKFSGVYENSLFCSQSGRLDIEVTKARNPRGVIILKEKDETLLFIRLMQILTVGNSVIVIYDTNFCGLTPYCDMFSTSRIPPGVINLLSNKNIKELELSLCATDYASYAKQFYSDNFDSPEKTYLNLTIPKQIIVPLK